MSEEQHGGAVDGSALTSGMKITIAAVVVVIVAALVAIVLLWSPWDASDAAAPGHPTAGTSTGATPDADEGSDSPGSAAAEPGPGPSPGATPQKGSEVLPPAETPGTGLPPLEKAEPLVSAPLPETASANGSLVQGFPTRVLGPIKGSTVISSAIATEGTHMQVTLIAVVPDSEKDIESRYGKLWADLGLQHGTTADGTLQYAGAYESVTLAITSSGTGNRYSLYGVFRTE